MHPSVRPSPLYDFSQEHDACGVGFIARTDGARTHDVLKYALAALKGLAHRGAIDADSSTGDGAGVMTQLPYELLRAHLESTRASAVPRDRDLAVGMLFLPRGDDLVQAQIKKIVIEAVKEEGLGFVAWREVPVDVTTLGRKAADTRPAIIQAIVARVDDSTDDEFERHCYLAQKVAEHRCAAARLDGFYACSLSSRTIVYKGLLNAPEVRRFFPDLRDPRFQTAFAIFHQRYSTNTFPTWHLAQPFRLLAHNGEINTIRGNRVRMTARERAMAGGVWGPRFSDLHPIIQPGMSDSASFDNVLQLLTLGGRSALHSMMMMAPLAWEQNPRLSEEARGFFKYHSLLLEPWDGPAALVFSDGRVVAATLDRNGLRPARYKIYDDGYVILASEHGLVDLPGQVVSTGRLAPGRMIAVDLQERRVLMDEDIKCEICEQPRWRDWCDKHLISLQQFAATAPAAEVIEPPAAFSASLLQQQLAHGYDAEEQELILTPLAEGLEPTGSMGDDTPLAVLSRKPRLLYTYFKQLFAQVTNPPIDSIREKSVMSLGATLGPRMGLFDTALATSGVLTLDSPILLDHEVAALFSVPFFRNGVVRLRAHFDLAAGPDSLGGAVRDLALRAESAVEQGAKLILVSDRGLAPDKAAIPMLLAVGAVQHQLIRAGLRFKCDVVAETAEAREVHHIACLVGFGANAVHPYLALASVRELAAKKKLPSPLTPAEAEKNYQKSIEAGLLKVMARMGISTLASYRGAQIFEAIGLGHKVVEECFAGTPSPIGGIGYRQIAEETLRRHERAFPRATGAASEAEALAAASAPADLPNEGYYKVAKKGDGEFHGWNPKVVAGMHKFLKGGAADDYKTFATTADEHHPVTLKDLLKVRFPERGLPLDEVEPIEDIRRRFTTAGMSLGALSPEAHETLALAMNRIGGKSNSGEGGEDPVRFGLRENGDSANSAIKQVASGRFGVTAEYLANAREIEIKMAQGAKPGEGGQLPGHKVSPLIARLRFSVPGVTLISPPPHHDIYSIEDLAQLIFDLKEVNPRAKVCVKLVACSGVGTIAAGVAKAYADVVLVSGHEGGTGASPLGSIKNAGSDWVLGVAEAHQVLMMNGLRNRVTLRTDGGMKTGRDIVIAAILGAEEFNFGTAALIAAGCAMFRVCHQNTCPVGVATQRDDLRAKFRGKPENVIAYFNAVAEEVRHYLARLGAHTLDDIIGRPELLEQIDDPANPKTRFLNLSGVLHNVDPTGQLDRIHTRERNERFPEGSLDETILQDARHVIAGRAGRFTGRYKVGNTNRCVGTHLSGQIAYLRGSHHPLAPRTLDLDLHGTAGQSFGTFLVQGVRLTLTGEANDYVGKGMSGGEIVIRPRADEVFAWETNTIIGNTCLYGATGGTLFAAGWAGERFAVRNSGATAVVEGCGDHGCEYMTRGAVVVLGRVGLNFGAGMSGGLAFLFDERNVVPQRVNPAMLKLERVTDADEGESLRSLVAAHAEATGSPHAQRLLAAWPATLAQFWKVIPNPPTADTPKPLYRYEPAASAQPELALAS